MLREEISNPTSKADYLPRVNVLSMELRMLLEGRTRLPSWASVGAGLQEPDEKDHNKGDDE